MAPSVDSSPLSNLHVKTLTRSQGRHAITAGFCRGGGGWQQRGARRSLSVCSSPAANTGQGGSNCIVHTPDQAPKNESPQATPPRRLARKAAAAQPAQGCREGRAGRERRLRAAAGAEWGPSAFGETRRRGKGRPDKRPEA